MHRKINLHEASMTNKAPNIARRAVKGTTTTTTTTTRSPANIVGKFATYAEIQAYICLIVSTYSTPSPNKIIANNNIIGRTFGGRNINILVLQTKTSTRSVWIDCGIHAVSTRLLKIL